VREGQGSIRLKMIDGMIENFSLGDSYLSDSLFSLNQHNSSFVRSKYILWNLKNFLPLKKLESTKQKKSFFLLKYFPNLSVSDERFKKWMANPCHNMSQEDSIQLTENETNILNEHLSRRSIQNKRKYLHNPPNRETPSPPPNREAAR